MLVLNQLDSWKSFCNKTSSLLEVTAYILCLVTLLVALFDNSISMDFYNVTAAISFVSLILRGKPKSFVARQWLLPLSILAIGIIDILWYSFFKIDNSVFRSTYHNYLNTAKIFIFGSTMILMALQSNIRIKREWLLYLLYSLSFIVAAYAFYTIETRNLLRLDFGIGTATGAAYSIMLIGIVSSTAILYTQQKHPLFFLINAAAVFATIALTQTRSALLVFPVICVLTLVASYIEHPKRLIFSVIGFFVSFIVLITIFSKPIYDRYHEGITNLTQYSNGHTSNNSLGARLAMYEIGFDLFIDSPVNGRSVENRAHKMREMAKEKPYLTGALAFANVHLHNELIEASSLKGIAGVITTLFFYYALLFTVYQYRSLGLLALSLAIIGLGLSDVILWSRSIPIIILTSIAILIFVKKNHSTDPIKI